MTDFSGKVAFITGAASGIGRSTARAFAAAGASVYLCDINEAGLAETAAEFDTPVKTSVLDVSSSADCTAAINSAAAWFGELDFVCNIAGIMHVAHFTDISDDDWNRVIAVNQSSVFYLSRAAIPHLEKSKGAMVNLSSIAGVKGQAYTAAYCASKAAVVMLTKSLALEYAKKGIRINAICPGGVNTAGIQGFTFPDEVDWAMVSRYGLLTEQITEPEEVADAAVYLCSDSARSISGITLNIDTGVTAG